MDEFAIIISIEDDNITPLYDGYRSELESIFELVKETDANAKLISVDEAEYKNCKNDSLELKQLIESSMN